MSDLDESFGTQTTVWRSGDVMIANMNQQHHHQHDLTTTSHHGQH
jgi:hypothetical protein